MYTAATDALGVAGRLKVVDVAELISLTEASTAEGYDRVDGGAING
ncbi:hypothetical protein [Mesorhizobium sp. B4-1-3]|nr:hypothetical protein [Mesorhizobium sp. B4-1-3]